MSKDVHQGDCLFQSKISVGRRSLVRRQPVYTDGQAFREEWDSRVVEPPPKENAVSDASGGASGKAE